MKKQRFFRFVLVSFLILILIGVAVADDFTGRTKYERYETNDDNFQGVNDGTNFYGQTFCVGYTGTNTTYYVGGITMKMYRVGSPGFINVSIWNLSINAADSTPNFTLTFNDSFNANSLSTDITGVWTNITMPQYQLQQGECYAVLFQCSACNGVGTIVRNRWDESSPTYLGGQSVSGILGAWSASNARDYMFRIFGTGDTTPPNSTINEPTGTKSNKTVNFNISILDSSNLSVCLYNVTAGASVEVAETSINCSSEVFNNFTVSSDGSYSFNFFVNDTNNNINVSNSSFTVDTSVASPAGPSGGGGGRTIIEKLTEPVLTPVCDPTYPVFEEKLAEWMKELLSFTKFKEAWFAYWDYSLCKQAASIIPVEVEQAESED